MSPLVRFARFNVVSALGLMVQLAVVAALVHGLGVDPIWATEAGVSAAVVHNFGWHVRWTWRDRMGPNVSRAAAFVRFAGANGLISLVGSIVLVPVLAAASLPVLVANLVAIAACGLVNYWVGDLGCFRSRRPIGQARRSSAVRA
jgi:putative flippase GtrA